MSNDVFRNSRKVISEGKVAWRRAFTDHVAEVIISHFHYLLDLSRYLVTSSCGTLVTKHTPSRVLRANIEKEASVHPK